MKLQQKQQLKKQQQLQSPSPMFPALTKGIQGFAIGTGVPTTGGSQKPSASSHVVKLRAPWISAREMKHSLARTLTRTLIVRLSREMASAMMPQQKMGK